MIYFYKIYITLGCQKHRKRSLAKKNEMVIIRLTFQSREQMPVLYRKLQYKIIIIFLL